MLNQRHEAAQAIASELFPAERQIEAAIIHSAKLQIAVVEGRKTAKLPITVGQEGLELVANANLRLIEARKLIGQAHLAFRETQVEVGLKAFSYGDIAECPPSSRQIIAPAANVA